MSKKYSRKTIVLFLIDQPGFVCLQTRELDQPSACFTGFALSVGLLHFAHFEAYCKTNIGKQSEMVLQVCQNSQTVLSLST